MLNSIRVHELATLLAPLLALPLFASLVLMAERARTRRALARLDDARLQDIGVSARVARREANKAFWH